MKVQTRSLTPTYAPDRGRDYSADTVHRPNTNYLSEFMYKFPQNTSPTRNNQRTQSPAGSESLLYSPFTGGADNESRVTRPSVISKSQQLNY